MSWISGQCQDDRHYSCTYSTFDTWEDFCIDSDTPCWSIYDNAGLISAVDNWAPADEIDAIARVLIIGKALEPLHGGTGEILVLLSLQ